MRHTSFDEFLPLFAPQELPFHFQPAKNNQRSLFKGGTPED